MSLLSVIGGIGKTVAGVATGNLGMITSGVGGIIGARSGAAQNPTPTQLPQLPQFPTQFPTSTTQSYGLTIGGFPVLGVSGSSSSGGGTQLPATKPGVGAVGVAPSVTSRKFSKCPKGYRLAVDGMCYPRAMIPRAFRKWKPEPRPIVSRADQKAIRKADHARHRLVRITKESGAWASMHRPHLNARKKR